MPAIGYTRRNSCKRLHQSLLSKITEEFSTQRRKDNTGISLQTA
jgi:hypothetical protein